MFPGVPACDLGDPANVDQLAATEKALAHLQQPRVREKSRRAFSAAIHRYRPCKPARHVMRPPC